jgi:hypothetical protein
MGSIGGVFRGKRMRGRDGVVKERLKEAPLRLERTVIPLAVIVPLWMEAIGKVRIDQAEEKMSNFFRASL